MNFSIITSPREFTGEYGALQDTAIGSWLELPGEPEIIFLDPDEVLEPRHGVDKIVRGFEKNKEGYVTMRSLFLVGEEHCSNDYVAFVNSDMVLFPNVVSSLETVISLVDTDTDFLLICGRCIIEPLQYEVGSVEWQDLKRLFDRDASFFVDSGQDVFIYRKGLWGKVDIPPFGLGGAWWDNWFCWAAEQTGATVIDISLSATALHPNHKAGPQLTSPNQNYNASLFQDIGWYPASRAPYYLSDGQLIRREREEDKEQEAK